MMDTLVKVLRTTDDDIANMIVEELLQTDEFAQCKNRDEAQKLLNGAMLHIKQLVKLKLMMLGR
jgi:hypothetical protein